MLTSKMTGKPGALKRKKSKRSPKEIPSAAQLTVTETLSYVLAAEILSQKVLFCGNCGAKLEFAGTKCRNNNPRSQVL